MIHSGLLGKTVSPNQPLFVNLICISLFDRSNIYPNREIFNTLSYLCRNVSYTCIGKLGHIFFSFVRFLLLLSFIVMLFLLHSINFVVYTIFLYAVCKSCDDL